MTDTLLERPAARSAASGLRVLAAVGTRPEHLKMAPVVTALRERGARVDVLHTGQHADPAMVGAEVVGHEVRPTYRWSLEGDEGERMGELTRLAYAHLAHAEPVDIVLVQGDTSTAAVGAMAARRHGVPVGHVEAGLRSGNERSQEELNRRMLGTLATVHFAPTAVSAANLTAEGVPLERIHVVGNPICDALATSGIDRVALRDRRGILVTAHRATNVDDPRRLAELVALLRGLTRTGIPVALPLHPRTRDRLVAAHLLDELQLPGLELLDPLPHRALLHRLAGSLVAVTDSGGLQEEASWYGVPVVVLRATTPRPEGVEIGQAVTTGLDARRAVAEVERLVRPEAQRRIAALRCPYGDGTAGVRIAAALLDRFALDALRIDEPAMAGGS